MNAAQRGPPEGEAGGAAVRGERFDQVSGLKAVLGLQPELEELARHCGQAGALDSFAFSLTDPYFGRKVPHALLLRGAAGGLRAAVLLHEYRLWGVRTGLFIPADSGGEYTVLAPAAMRRAVAWRAAQFLLGSGAWLVLLSLLDTDFAPGAGRSGLPTRATQTRVLRRELPLLATMDATLAQFGARSRRNFRAYRRRLSHQLGVVFHADAAMDERAFLELNREGAYRVPNWVAQRRYAYTRAAAGGFLAGLQDRDGRWLTTIGGRREDARTVIDWQVNRSDLPRLSVGTVMRSYLLEYEIGRGSKLLRFQGGTRHPMQSAFTVETVGDLLLARGLLTPWFLRQVVRRMLPKGSVLGDTLESAALVWQR